MDLVAGDARDVVLASRSTTPGPSRPGPLHRPPAPRRRPRPHVARPVHRGRAVGERQRRAARLPRRPDRARDGGRDTGSGSSSGSTRTGSRRVAGLPDELHGALAGRWIELLEEELGLLQREEKPWIRDMAGRIVVFSRQAAGARDVDLRLGLLSRLSLRKDSSGAAVASARVAQRRPRRPPGASISSTSTPWHDRGWRNATGPSAPLRATLSMSSIPSSSSRMSAALMSVDLEADVVEPLALALEEPRDAGRVVGRLDELDLRLPHRQERDRHPVLLDRAGRAPRAGPACRARSRALSSMSRTMTATWWTLPRRRIGAGRSAAGVTRSRSWRTVRR